MSEAGIPVAISVSILHLVADPFSETAIISRTPTASRHSLYDFVYPTLSVARQYACHSSAVRINGHGEAATS